MSSKSYSTIQLTLRSLEPTATSVVGCLLIGIAIVALHLLALSLNYGTILPTIFDGQWATAYTNHIVQPIETAINNQFLSSIVNLVLWGILGLVIYTIIEHVGRDMREWRETEENIQITGQAIVQHPLREMYLLRMLWRLAVGILFVSFLVLAHPTIGKLFKVDNQLFVGQLSLQILPKLLAAMLVWAILTHVTMVLLRLYLFRTRLGTDHLY